MQVCLLPMTRAADTWAKKNARKGQDYLIVDLVGRMGERFTVRGANGKERTFGPHDATWTRFETEIQRNERVMTFTANCIADWVQDRDSVLAEAIRQGQWRSSWKGKPVSSKFLTIEPSKPKRKRVRVTARG